MPTSIVNLTGKDFGGYWILGTLGDLGSKMKETAGKAYGGWVLLFDALVTPFFLTWFGVTDMGNSYNMFMLNMYWDGIDYQPRDNSLGFFVCGTNGLGWAYWIDLDDVGININDSKYHHIMVNFKGLTSGKPDEVYICIDGVMYDMKVEGTDFSDTPALTGSVVNFAQNVYLGCDGKGSSPNPVNVPIDMSTLNVADLIIVDRFVTQDELTSIVRSKGAYMISPANGLHTRIPFMFDGRNLGYHGVAATPTNNGGGSSSPTILADKAPLITCRKRVM